MIPKIIHYCWFGCGQMPQTALDCIESWHRFMPDWEYKLWTEDNFDVYCNRYVREAFEAGKFAFVSDYVRLVALRDFGGLYLDTDVKVLKCFDNLMEYDAFCGFEGSKHKPIGTCVMASKANGEWISEMLEAYNGRHFVNADGSFNLTTNTTFLSSVMEKGGFIRNGLQQAYKDCTIFPTDYFCPRQTTGEYLLTENTYCDHLGASSWAPHGKSWKSLIRRIVGPKNMTRLIKLKRRFERL